MNDDSNLDRVAPLSWRVVRDIRREAERFRPAWDELMVDVAPYGSGWAARLYVGNMHFAAVVGIGATVDEAVAECKADYNRIRDRALNRESALADMPHEEPTWKRRLWG